MEIAQVQVLNKILSTQDYSIVTLNNLTEDYFYLYKDEFKYIQNHYNLYGAVPDKVTFQAHFPDFDFIEVKESDLYLLDELFKDFNSQYLRKSFNKIKNLLESNKIEEASTFFLDAAQNMHAGQVLSSVDILKDTSRYDAYLERTQDFKKYYITTGFQELDAIIGGWDREEEYALVVARTNNGKSFITLKMAIAAAAQGLRVGIYSGEMSAKKVGYRADSIIGHISNGAIIHGNIAIQAEYEKYIKLLPNKLAGSIKVLTPNDIAGPVTVSVLRSFIEKESLDLLVVDQVSLLQDQHRAKSPVEAMANISKDLKLLQVFKRIPLVVVSQLNRTKNDDSNDESISTTMVAQSDRLSQDATTIIGLAKDKKDSNLLKIQVVKSRDGRVGDILSYRCDYNKGMFTYIPDENSPQIEEAKALSARYEDDNGEVF